MNRKVFLAFIMFCGVMAGMMTACSETDDEEVEYPNWQKRNVAYFDSIYNEAIQNKDGKWDTIRAWSLSDTEARLQPYDYIVVHKEEVGTGSGCPLYTDSVMVHNLGKLLPSTSYPDGYVIEKSWTGDFEDYNPQTARAKKWYVGGLIDGYTTVLQRMHIGDRWRVYVPYKLAYGTTDYNGIPAYSNIIWDIKLLGYYHPGGEQPYLDAKKANTNLWVME